jgi:hypothetical protein
MAEFYSILVTVQRGCRFPAQADRARLTKRSFRAQFRRIGKALFSPPPLGRGEELPMIKTWLITYVTLSISG